MNRIFDLTATVPDDESIERISFSEHNPIVGTDLNRPGTIQIIIENQDAYFFPPESY